MPRYYNYMLKYGTDNWHRGYFSDVESLHRRKKGALEKAERYAEQMSRNAVMKVSARVYSFYQWSTGIKIPFTHFVVHLTLYSGVIRKEPEIVTYCGGEKIT